MGASGTYNLDGWLVSDDYNRDLRWPESLKTYQRMRLSDGSVREALWHIFAPLLGASWTIEPCSDEQQDLEIAEFARMVLNEWLTEPFEQALRTALLYLAQGYQVFETVEQIVEAELTFEDANGVAQTSGRRQFVAWKRLAHRRPETIYRWFMRDGELAAVQQQLFSAELGQSLTPTIPAEQLLVFVNEQEGDDFRGVSLLRSAYKAWWMKETIEKVAAIAYERHGVGVPVAYVPMSRQDDAKVLSKAEDMLRTLRAGEFSYLVWPGPKSTGTLDGYTFEIASPTGGIPDFTPFLGYLRGELKGNVLARFSELGHGSVGARATGDVQSQVWYDALKATADYMAAIFNDGLRRLIAKNYQTESFPSLCVRDLEARNLAEFAHANAELVSVGAVLPDKSYREAVRTYMGLPDEDEGEESAELDTEPEGPPPTDDQLPPEDEA